MSDNDVVRFMSSEDDLIMDVLQQAWTKLLTMREEGKLTNFDIEVPSQVLSWVEDIYKQQLATYEQKDPTRFKNKKFAIAISFRVALNNILGIDYFMEQMNDKPRMAAMDILIEDIYGQIRKDNEMRRELR